MKPVRSLPQVIEMLRQRLLKIVISAQAEIHLSGKQWIPAFAGMTFMGNVFQLTLDQYKKLNFCHHLCFLQPRPRRFTFFDIEVFDFIGKKWLT